MKRYVDYLGTKADGHILSHGLGDWCDLGPKYPGRAQLTSLAGTATPIYYMDAETIRKAAEKMGRKEDAAKYGKLAQDIRKAYNEKYYHPQTGSYDKNSQAGNALALYSGICEPQNRDAVLANLVQDIRSRGNALTAGDVGYNYVLRALEQSGNSQVIFDMNSRYDVYGYGYMLAQGATALPESWQALPRKSHNHLMLGHLLEWFYTYVGGIRRDDSVQAYKKFIVRPEIVGGLVPLALWTDPQRVDDRTERFRPVGRGAGQHNGADIRPRPCRQPGLRKRARSRAVQGCRKPRYGGRVPRIRRWVGYLPLQRAIGDPVWKRGYCAGTAFLLFCRCDAVRALRRVPARFLHYSRRLPARCPHSP